MWDGGYNLHTTVYTEGVHDIDYEGLGDMLVPTAKPGEWVPLRQVATLTPTFKHNNLPHRNGMKCITVSADVMTGAGQLKEFATIDKYIENNLNIPDDIIINKGGSMAVTVETMPSLIQSILAAIVVMFIVLIFHYTKIGISLLSLSLSANQGNFFTIFINDHTTFNCGIRRNNCVINFRTTFNGTTFHDDAAVNNRVFFN